MQFAEMNAKSVAALLSGTPKGNHWVAPCPHCQPEGRGYQFGLRISDTAHGCDFLCIHGKCSTFDILRSAGLAVSFSDAQAILFEVEAHKQRGSEANQLEDRKSFRRNSVPISGTLANSISDQLASHAICRLRCASFLSALPLNRPLTILLF